MSDDKDDIHGDPGRFEVGASGKFSSGDNSGGGGGYRC